MLLTATLEGFVWVDSDGNGQQGNFEPGLNGVDVELTGAGLDGMFFTMDDTFDSRVTVNNGFNNGAYSFADLDPGLYIVTFLPFFDNLNMIGYTRTAANIGPDVTDSDADVGTGLTQVITLLDGEINSTIGAGYTTGAAIGNFVWDDLDADGLQDTLEPGIPNVTVNLTTGPLNALVVTDTTTTDVGGMYWFTNVAPGDYRVQFVIPTGYSNASPPNNLAQGDDTFDSDADPMSGITEVYQIGEGEFNDTIDAGFYNELGFASLGDFVWDDLNGNGQQDIGEPGIDGVTVTLTGAGLDDQFGTGDDITEVTITAFNGTNDGAYNFADLLPGQYYLTFTDLPVGYVFTAPNVGHDATDSDADLMTGTTGIYVLNSGENNSTIGAGAYVPVSIGDFTWVDTNGNGQQDLGEPGLNGVQVTLTGAGLDGTFGTGDDTSAMQMTANNGINNGAYKFIGLRPSRYKVTFGAVVGYVRTVADTGPDATDSDANVLTGMTGEYTLVSGQYDDSVDAGYNQLATIGGVKYQDLTGNGLSADDTPLGGTVINLYKDTNLNGARDTGDGPAVATATTAAVTGTYSFSVATFGLYFVEEVVPSGYVRTAPTYFNYSPIKVSANVNYGGNNFANFKLCDLSQLTNVSYVINGTTTVTNLRGKVNQGDTVKVNFTIKAGAAAHQYSLVSYTAPGSVCIDWEASQQQVFHSATGVFGPGSHSMTIVVPNCYFQIDFVCGAILTTLGPEGSNLYYTPQGRLISADNDGTQACAPSSLSGYVYLDANNNGLRNKGEAGIANVSVTLTGTDIYGTAVTRTTMTNSSGYYVFGNLKPSNTAGYTLTETQPSSYLDGKDAIGSQGGTTGNDVLVTKLLNTNTRGINNNFGELPLHHTKFYVVNSATTDRTYEYNPSGALVESYALNRGNTNPRGVTTTAAGTKVWVIDANRRVFVYNTSGGLLGSWTAGSLPRTAVVEDITTNGTDVWLVDAKGRRVYKYAAAASRLSGSQNAASSFTLNAGNLNARGIVTDGTSLWTVNDSTTDKVFKYSISGTYLGNWTIATENRAPSGIAINPADVNHIWIVDSSTCKVYQYSDAATRLSGSQSAASMFVLASGNTAPQGIADPPPQATSPVAAGQNMTTARGAGSAGPILNRVASLLKRLPGDSTRFGQRDLHRNEVSPLPFAVRNDLAAAGIRNRKMALSTEKALPVSFTWRESTSLHTVGPSQSDDIDALFAVWETDPVALLTRKLVPPILTAH